MSENQTPAPQPAERSMGQEIVRQSTINVVATAAGIVGLYGGLVAISKIASWKERKSDNDTANTEESETTES
jgi:hypothetical protein